MYNMNIVNPAYAGSRGTLSIGLLGRTQWVGIDGAPKTATLSVHAPVGRNLAAGFSAISDSYGPVQEQNIYADISYTISTSEEGRLAFGLKGGITLFDVGLLSAVLPQTLPGVDPLFSDNINELFPNFGAGAYYYNERFYVGLSVPNILETKHLERQSGSITRAAEETHYFLSAGYVFDLSADLKLKPAVLLKAVQGAPLQADISGNLLLNDKLTLGLAYRWDAALSGLIGFQLSEGLMIGYAYDWETTELNNYNSGSHEIILRYELRSSKGGIISPRFF